MTPENKSLYADGLGALADSICHLQEGRPLLGLKRAKEAYNSLSEMEVE